MHEDNLINHRLSWNLTIQGFLFASYTLALTKIADIRIEVSKIADFARITYLRHSFYELRILLNVIVIIGISVSLSVYINVLSAEQALAELDARWSDLNPSYRSDPPRKANTHGPDRMGLPGLRRGGTLEKFAFGRLGGIINWLRVHAATFLPFASIVTWIILWLYVGSDL